MSQVEKSTDHTATDESRDFSPSFANTAALWQRMPPMPNTLSLADVQQSWNTRDPQFIRLLSQLSTQSEPTPETPIRDGAPTFDGWLAYLRSPEFKRKSREEQRAARIEKLKAVEAPTAEVPLPDRLKAHKLIEALWESDDPLARDCLLRTIAECPLVYGPWRALKKIFKEAEAKNDTEVYGALAARFDSAMSRTEGQVSGATLAYLSRRAWRYLRRVALQLPVTYADIAVDVLIHYTDDTNWKSTWLLNQIFYHERKNYGRTGFRFSYREPTLPSDIKSRAYADLWKRSPRPLFTLLERAQSDPVREFAAACLKADFKTVLRDVEADWVIRLVSVPSAAVHDFVVWILQNVPKFEQSEFRKLKLHEPVLLLFESPSNAARKYTADYARTHARDLSVDELVKLFGNDNDAVRKLARDLLSERDPRKAVGLEAWGRLLETEHGHEFAAEVLIKSFGAKDLTPEWFAERLISGSEPAREFAKEHLPKVHSAKSLGTSFYVALAKRCDPDNDDQIEVAEWAVAELAKLDLATVPLEDLRWLALFPATESDIHNQVAKKKLKPQTLGMDFLKMLAYQPDWEASGWLTDFRARNGQWAKDVQFDESRSASLLNQFADVQDYSTADLGFDWLMMLVARPEPNYHDFAKQRMIRTLSPADFAPAKKAVASSQAQTAPAQVDLQKKSFLFTGKLASMTRDEAEAKVKAANGIASGSVTKNLHYLVVGDEGSPLYGQGKKGSKQVKAEELNAAGSNISIISETAFLQMASGVQLAVADADSTTAGCAKLWEMVNAPGRADAPVAAFAREFVRLHHKPICQELTGKGPDPGTEVPAEFLNWNRFAPLFGETRKPLRDLALEFAGYDFARWAPPVEDLLVLSESPFVDVRRLVAKSLLAEPGKATQNYRLDPARLAPAAIYRFCESADEETRALGMELIRRLPKLQVPEELFRLSESPDRKVRAFVIRSLWQVYRNRGLTEHWKPTLPPPPTVGAKAVKDAKKREAEQGSGVPTKPRTPPADQPTLGEFLRRVLFELPPGPPEKSRGGGEQANDAPLDDAEPTSNSERQVSLKPIPARRAKLDAVEVMRDLALDDKSFASGILPLLDEFLATCGTSEKAACLVAVTRIRHKHAELKK
jgi:hypothetical protein